MPRTNYRCNYLDDPFSRLASADSEREQWADPDRFRCKLCGQTYSTIRHLRDHVKIVHGESSDYYVSIRPNLKLSMARKRRHEKSDSESDVEGAGGAWSDDKESNDNDE
ncbi:hypothetical protein PRIPAC_87679 [Pristionchus pacificus]|uniref:C2H2-type domain-containing protein n=1 Tax=Pristionchus pacificus TaxID=54126 RepID=A0A2A6CWC5_PRIPA|nr:hypothetical protein PRIPAC_87679 [Pristionchus pacificus]|eukprot:PDM82347.1 hypothetical protein PRIPAC_36740 [Pristionchus pacificus]